MTIGPIAGVLLANGLVLAVAGALVARGLAVRDRGAFLGGTGIAAFAGFLRFAEYDHDLTRKALAFVVVGIAFVAAAWLYERRPAREAAHAA
ncbi:MAG TPA: hypothetical protein VFF00_08675 [Candidatus Elarobacter sp.]|nr:hypothetical protein [Candidatus Elarobacter sp.]